MKNSPKKIQFAERGILERNLCLRCAKNLLSLFLGEKIPEKDFSRRVGITKVMLEEYYPLVCLAESIKCSGFVKLTRNSYMGHDAEIKLKCGGLITLQITCSCEDYQISLLREQMMRMKNEITSINYNRFRDRETGEIMSIGEGIVPVEADIDTRIQRILNAIRKKTTKYYKGTDVLLIQEDALNYKSLKRRKFHEILKAEVNKLIKIPYVGICVVYGKEVEYINCDA